MRFHKALDEKVYMASRRSTVVYLFINCLLT